MVWYWCGGENAGGAGAAQYLGGPCADANDGLLIGAGDARGAGTAVEGPTGSLGTAADLGGDGARFSTLLWWHL